MSSRLLVGAVAVVVTAAVGLLDGQGWPSYLIGAVLCLALWVMLFSGSLAAAGDRRGVVHPASYAVAAVVGVVLGLVLTRVGDGNSAFWAAGFIAAGAIVGCESVHQGRERRRPSVVTSPEPGPGALLGVAATRRQADEAQAALSEAVAAARGAGHTWAEIGGVLGVTRQAAFKRFGAPRDPRTGALMTTTPTDGLIEATERVFAEIDAGDYEAVRARMPDDVAAVLTRDVVLDTWARAVSEAGNLERCEGTRLEASDGSGIEAGAPVIGIVIGSTELVCEAGSWAGRVAFDDQARVVGLLVVPPGTTNLPF